MSQYIDIRFPDKLFKFLEEKFHESLSWSECGLYVVIEKNSFTRTFLEGTMFFKTSNFSSIVRQFNLYRFRKVPNKQRKVYKGDFVKYYHENFRRDGKNLLNLVRRTSASSRTSNYGTRRKAQRKRYNASETESEEEKFSEETRSVYTTEYGKLSGRNGRTRQYRGRAVKRRKRTTRFGRRKRRNTHKKNNRAATNDNRINELNDVEKERVKESSLDTTNKNQRAAGSIETTENMHFDVKQQNNTEKFEYAPSSEGKLSPVGFETSHRIPSYETQEASKMQDLPPQSMFDNVAKNAAVINNQEQECATASTFGKPLSHNTERGGRLQGLPDGIDKKDERERNSMPQFSETPMQRPTRSFWKPVELADSTPDANYDNEKHSLHESVRHTPVKSSSRNSKLNKQSKISRKTCRKSNGDQKNGLETIVHQLVTCPSGTPYGIRKSSVLYGQAVENRLCDVVSAFRAKTAVSYRGKNLKPSYSAAKVGVFEQNGCLRDHGYFDRKYINENNGFQQSKRKSSKVRDSSLLPFSNIRKKNATGKLSKGKSLPTETQIEGATTYKKSLKKIPSTVCNVRSKENMAMESSFSSSRADVPKQNCYGVLTTNNDLDRPNASPCYPEMYGQNWLPFEDVPGAVQNVVEVLLLPNEQSSHTENELTADMTTQSIDKISSSEIVTYEERRGAVTTSTPFCRNRKQDIGSKPGNPSEDSAYSGVKNCKIVFSQKSIEFQMNNNVKEGKRKTVVTDGEFSVYSGNKETVNYFQNRSGAENANDLNKNLFDKFKIIGDQPNTCNQNDVLGFKAKNITRLGKPNLKKYFESPPCIEIASSQKVEIPNTVSMFRQLGGKDPSLIKTEHVVPAINDILNANSVSEPSQWMNWRTAGTEKVWTKPDPSKSVMQTFIQKTAPAPRFFQNGEQKSGINAWKGLEQAKTNCHKSSKVPPKRFIGWNGSSFNQINLNKESTNGFETLYPGAAENGQNSMQLGPKLTQDVSSSCTKLENEIIIPSRGDNISLNGSSVVEIRSNQENAYSNFTAISLGSQPIKPKTHVLSEKKGSFANMSQGNHRPSEGAQSVPVYTVNNSSSGPQIFRHERSSFESVPNDKKQSVVIEKFPEFKNQNSPTKFGSKNILLSNQSPSNNWFLSCGSTYSNNSEGSRKTNESFCNQDCGINSYPFIDITHIKKEPASPTEGNSAQSVTCNRNVLPKVENHTAVEQELKLNFTDFVGSDYDRTNAKHSECDDEDFNAIFSTFFENGDAAGTEVYPGNNFELRALPFFDRFATSADSKHNCINKHVEVKTEPESPIKSAAGQSFGFELNETVNKRTGECTSIEKHYLAENIENSECLKKKDGDTGLTCGNSQDMMNRNSSVYSPSTSSFEQYLTSIPNTFVRYQAEKKLNNLAKGSRQSNRPATCRTVTRKEYGSLNAVKHNYDEVKPLEVPLFEHEQSYTSILKDPDCTTNEKDHGTFQPLMDSLAEETKFSYSSRTNVNSVKVKSASDAKNRTEFITANLVGCEDIPNFVDGAGTISIKTEVEEPNSLKLKKCDFCNESNRLDSECVHKSWETDLFSPSNNPYGDGMRSRWLHNEQSEYAAGISIPQHTTDPEESIINGINMYDADLFLSAEEMAAYLDSC